MITVILATHDRADDLERTLQGMANVDRAGLKVNFRVVDNNSSDDTAGVCRRFASILDLAYLFEPKPGKNAALNHALGANDIGDLGELVVFTDDDVTPRTDWLQQIADVSRRWPDFQVFGGRTHVVWPAPRVPAWAISKEILHWGFSSNEDIGSGEFPYPAGRYPVGFNYWIRSFVLEDGPRFDESIGPVPENRIMGDETRFQIALEQRGHRILYTDRAVVGHRIQPAMMTPAGIRRRAVFIGRTGPRLQGLSHAGLLARHPRLWFARRRASMLRYACTYGLGWLSLDPDRRVERTVRALRGYSANREMLRMAKAQPGTPDSERS